jgi:formate hydrogenlyase subunit 3/multisubunit Na+/H+ antiporter MnhD subunit
MISHINKTKTEGYPFGGEGPTPYYYKSLESYISNTLTWSIIFVAILIFSIFSITHKNHRLQYFSFGLMVVAVIAMLMNGKIGT